MLKTGAPVLRPGTFQNKGDIIVIIGAISVGTEIVDAVQMRTV